MAATGTRKNDGRLKYGQVNAAIPIPARLVIDAADFQTIGPS